MLSPRWRKVIRDLLGSKGRTTLVVLAIAVGVFAFGSVFITQEVLLKNIQDQYLASNASTITLNISNFDSNLINWVKTQAGVSEASGKADYSVKLIFPDGKEEILNLTAVPDYSRMRLNLLIPQKGVWPPGKGEIVLERNSLAGSKLFIGDNVKIKTPEDKNYELVLSGSVYNNSGFPYIFTRQFSGFISWDTLALLGFPKRFNKLEIATSSDIKTLEEAEKLTYDLTENLRDRGVRVGGSMVFQPNEHWAADNSKAFTAILSVIGIFSLILSGFLVVNTVSALLAQQNKQIGIMKAIGANQKQVIALYLLLVGFYGFLALFIALPAGMLLGYIFLKLVTDFLNLNINTFYLPTSVFFMELAASLVIPIVAAIIPIYQNSKKPIREVISDHQPLSKVGRLDRILAKIGGLSRPLLISLRNAFRKSGRLALTLGTLVTAGALFMGVLNVRTGMYKEMDRILSMFDFQVSIDLSKDYNSDSLIARIKEVPNVTEVEARTHVSAQRIKLDGTKGSRFGITGLPPETPFSHPVVLSGRWLIQGDKNRIVLTSAYIRDNPDLSPGDNLYVAIGNDKYHLEIVGVIAMSETLAFSDFDTVAQLKDTPTLASSYLIKTSPDDPVTQAKVANDVEDRLDRSGIKVSFKQTKNDIIAAAANQFNFMIFFLLAMAVMVAIVGGLGLAGTMSLNVLERTREIGIMRSIGANDKAIRKLVLTEGLLIGFISWLVAIPLSLPLTYGFCFAIGTAFFERILVFTVVPTGMLMWLVIVMIIAVVASVLPANRASKMSISETLSYE